MLLRVFRENQAFTVLFVLLLSALLWIFTGFKTSLEPNISLLYNHSGFSLFPGLRSINNNTSLSVALNILIVLVSGYYLSWLTQRHLLMPGRSLMPMVLYFMFSLPWFANYSGFSYPLLAIFVLMVVVDRLFASAERKSLSFSYFNIALLISLASILYFNILFYLLFVVFLFFRLRGGYWRELAFVIVGACIPYFFLFGILYIGNNSLGNYFDTIKMLWSFNTAFVNETFFWINTGYICLLFFVASWHAMNQYVKMKIITRKFSVALLVLFLFTLIFALLLPAENRENLLFVAAPLSFLFGYYFTTCRINILNQVFFVLFIIGNVGSLVLSLI